jgi:hypothetical protein
MNHKASKLEITQKLDELLSAIEQLLKNENDTGFYKELSKHKLIQLYNSLDSYNNSNSNPNKKEETATAVQSKTINFEHQLQIEDDSPIQSNHQDTDNESITNKTESIAPQEQTEPIQETTLIEAQEEIIEDHSEPIQVDIVETPIAVVFEPELEDMKQTEEKSEKQVQQPDKQTQILSDKFKKENTSVFEKYSSKKEDTSIGSQLQTTPLLDLKKSIGINDRFSYINELFSGSKDNFDKFIDSIIQAPTAEDIISVLDQNSSENSWNSKPSFAKFSEMIKRYSLSK